VQRTVSIEQKSAWLRDANGGTSQSATEVLSLRYYSAREIAELLNLSQDSVRKLFQDEPGVLVLGDQSSKYKRRYTTLRIPDSVLRRCQRQIEMSSSLPDRNVRF
jgi:hypothetical protein